ncbi:MAG: carboxypeptidase-like regulatory domain-containing protein [Bacteroidales bacterium]|nr:carboxypeptidase-like regulatory domain-containing protein [Bacteroidales bacterium]
MKNLLLVVFVLCGFITTSYSQVTGEISVTGTVKGYGDIPLVGADVLIEGSTTGTMTDIDGKYSISCHYNSRLVFIYPGYITKKEDIKGRRIINVTLEEDLNASNSVYRKKYQEALSKNEFLSL